LGGRVDLPTFKAHGTDGKRFVMAAVAHAGIRLW
jgi:hypothetical protein